MSIVPDKAVMRLSPKVRLRIGDNGELIVVQLPIARFVEPDHGHV
jgi:hypothetical protein